MSQSESPSPVEPNTADGEPMLTSSAMHQHYGGLLKVVFERFFGPIHYPEKSADTIRELAKVGVIVYTARARSTWLALYFNFTLNRLDLPLAGFVGGINLFLWQPVTRVVRMLSQRMREATTAWRTRYGEHAPTRHEVALANNVFRGESAFLFLQDQGRLGRKTQPGPNDYLRALVAAQRITDKPIYLVAHAVTSLEQGGSARSTLTERLFGARPRRRRRNTVALPLWGNVVRRAQVRVADPIDLSALVAENADLDDEQIARRARHELDRRISDEERVVAGPELPSRETMARQVLRNRLVQEEIEREVEQLGKTAAALEAKATGYLHEIAANYRPLHTARAATIMKWIFTRIYDGVVVDEAGLARVLDVARRGPVVMCPSHRSHVDYLVLSTMMVINGITPPHIAAGANLSFFPLGWIFRHAGAFFLRRTFGDNKLYAATFRAYIGELLRRGTMLEFFIEGTRSRTGKVLMPRLGLLSMVVNAWRNGVRDDVFFAPASIDYEQIIEAHAYERELRGGQKRPEDISGLLKAPRVLRSRYGRVHLQFAEPISLAEIARARGLPQDPSPEFDEAWRAETERLGYRILHQVATCSSAIPTSIAATTLLAYQGRGMAHGRMVQRSLELVDYLDTEMARLSASLQDPETREQAVVEAVQRFVEQKAVAVERAGRADVEPIYRVIDERRIQLDYYKNALMNYMAPAALICRSLQRRSNQCTYDDLYADNRFLSRLFKREFLYRADATFATHFDDALASLAARGFCDVHEDGRVVIREPESVGMLAGQLDSFLQGYWVTVTTAAELKQFPMWKRELVDRALERARRAFLEGQISRAEAASRTLVSNAIGWMIAVGVLETDGSKRQSLKLSEAFAGDALDKLTGDIAAFL